MGTRRPVHPLLLESGYWNRRLEELERQPAALLTPRPDLCARGADVTEFRVQVHDSAFLAGLMAQPRQRAGSWPARVRSVESLDDLAIDRQWLAAGGLEVVFLSPPGRRLEDRVMDLVQVTRLIQRSEQRPSRLSFGLPGDEMGDEFLIIDHLVEKKFI